MSMVPPTTVPPRTVPSTSPTTVPPSTSPTTVPPGGAPVQANPYAVAGQAASGTATAPATGNNSWYGLTGSDLNVEVNGDRSQGSFASLGEKRVGDEWSGSQTTFDPFNIGVPIQPDSSGGYTVGAMIQYIESLAPDQIGQVQAELAGAGYYGPMNTLMSEPVWKSLGSVDFKAIGAFAKDLIVGANNGSTASSVLAKATAQWNVIQQNNSTKTPVKDLGKNYTITNLDPNMAGSMVDQTALKVLGHSLSAQDRQRLSGWMNDMYTSRQRSVDQGDIQQNATNAQAIAEASDLTNPQTGQALDHNGVTAAARSQLGVQYQWGGTAPGQGLDCSGLTQYAYKQNGIQIPRTSQQQWADPNGHNFNDMSQAAPGDLVFFGGDGTGPTHVGVYLGNGMMIDAPHTGSQVEIDNVSQFATADALVGFKHYSQVNNTTVASTNLPPGTDTGSPAAETVKQVAAQIASETGVDANKLTQIALATMQQESGGNPAAVGDNGSSFGLFQLHQGGELGNLTPQQAFDPATNASTAIRVMAQELKANPQGSVGQIAAAAQRPADPAGYAASVDAIAGGGSATLAGNATGRTDANGGRSILSTPNTFTNATDESSAALQSSLEAQLRAENPAQAQAHDMTNAYTMLAKSLRDGITVNNS